VALKLIKQSKKSMRELLKDPNNVAAHQKFKAMADSQEKKKADVAKLFDPVALMARAGEIHQVTHPQLGIIRFGELKLSDAELVSKCKSKDDRSAMAVYLMLKKAYPDMAEYTPETIVNFYRAFPMVEGTALLQFFLSQPCFLGENSQNGSEQTQALTS
jgi:hypothetical protein